MIFTSYRPALIGTTRGGKKKKHFKSYNQGNQKVLNVHYLYMMQAFLTTDLYSIPKRTFLQRVNRQKTQRRSDALWEEEMSDGQFRNAPCYWKAPRAAEEAAVAAAVWNVLLVTTPWENSCCAFWKLALVLLYLAWTCVGKSNRNYSWDLSVCITFVSYTQCSALMSTRWEISQRNLHHSNTFYEIVYNDISGLIGFK